MGEEVAKELDQVVKDGLLDNLKLAEKLAEYKLPLF